jgi:hypothetical protein
MVRGGLDVRGFSGIHCAGCRCAESEHRQEQHRCNLPPIGCKAFGLGDPLWEEVLEDRVGVRFTLVMSGR